MIENDSFEDKDSVYFEDLVEEFSRQCREGQRPSIERLASQHPQHAETIRELFPAIEAMECLGAADNSKKRFQQAQAKFDLNQPDSIGDFKIVEEIGRGGMGIVYKAVQQSLGRPVAIKILLRTSNEPKQIARFEREAATAAKLHHTNIVPVFGVGHQDGFHYYVMQLIDGVGVDQLIVALKNPSVSTPNPLLDSIVSKLRNELPTEEGKSSVSSSSGIKSNVAYLQKVAGFGRTIAGAIGYAHQQGTLHRDIKPGNLLLDTDSNIWLADFGLAKATESDELSRTGDVIGTMRYMAPEQFAGSPDERSDVYGLGLTLYEMISLHPAYDLSSRTHLVSGKRSSRSKLRPLQHHVANIPRDLATIVMKACELNPADRYQSALDLEADLDNYLNDRPIHARPPSIFENAAKWCRRNPWVASLSALAATLLLVIAGISTVAYSRSQTALIKERNQRTMLEIEKRRVQTHQATTEKTLEISLAALDRIFDRLTPDVAQNDSTTTIEGTDGASLVIRNQPVLSSDTAMLLEEMLETYDRLAKLQGDDPRLISDSAKASQRVGEIHRELGAFQDAAKAFELAIQKYQRLPSTEFEQAQLSCVLGDIYRRLKLDEKSTAAFDASLAQLSRLKESMSSETAESFDVDLELGRVHYLMAKRAPPSFEREKPPKPLDFFAGFLKGPPDNSDRSLNKAQELHLESAIDILTTLVDSPFESGQARFLLALCYREESKPGNENARDQSIKILRQLVADRPNAADIRYELAEALSRPMPRGRKRTDFSSNELAESKRMLDQLVADHPNIP